MPARITPCDNRPCLCCAVTFTPRNERGRFCSRRCAGKYLHRARQANAGVVRTGRTCLECLGDIPVDARTDSVYCSATCRARKNQRKSNIRKMGISPEGFAALLASQGGTCAVPGCTASECGNGRRLHIDHDHACCPGRWSCGECIRGLLCDRHNVALGFLGDDLAEIEALAAYKRGVLETAVA